MGALVGTMVMAGPAAAQAPAPKQIGVFKDWAAFEVTEKDGKACYIASAPQDKEPKNVQRGDVWAIVTHRPWKGVRSELSIYTGYPYQGGSKVKLSVDGSQNFELYTHEETAWAQNAGEDTKIAASMRRGNRMVITGVSARGTTTVDRYSLSGFTAAHKAIDEACPK
ncbi:MAG: invasion associated locus B family protein [Alphaproteobacteria bacterium]